MFRHIVGSPKPSRSSDRSLPLLPFLMLVLWGQLIYSQNMAAASASPQLVVARAKKPVAESRNSLNALGPQNTVTQDPAQIITLELGKPIERELTGGHKHSYQIALSEGQYAKVEINWQGIDLGVSLQLPDGKTIPLLDPLGNLRELTIEQVAESAGIYRVNVYTRSRAPTGRYEIRISELHPATENEQALQQARRSFQEYVQLMRVGKFVEGRPLLTRALEIRERVLGADSLLVAKTLSVLANNFQNAGDIASAETLRIRALKIMERALAPDDPELAEELEYLGNLYQAKGDDFKAEEIYQRSLGIFAKADRTENLIVESVLRKLGDIHYERGDYQNAESFYERSRAILEKLLGPDHFHLSFSFASLGRVAYDAADYSKAEAMFQRALTLSEKALGPDHIEVTPRRNDLAMLYCTTGDYAKARALYERTLSLHEQQKPMTDPNVQETLFGLARLYAAQGLLSEAATFQSRASELEEHYVELNLAVGSEREKLAFLNAMSAHSTRSISLHTNLAPNDQTARNLAVTTILQHKGRAQDAMSASLSALRERSGAEDQKLLDQLNDLTSRLARLVLNGPMGGTRAEHQERIKTLEEQREEVEAEISGRSAGFYQRPQPVTLAAVQAVVPENAALIEFAVYRPFDPRAPYNQRAYGAPRYVAYVIRNQGEARWTELGTAKEIEAAVDALRQALRDPQSKDVQELAHAVDEKVMRPVRALLGNATQLLISPDGQLNLIPFAALVDEHGRYLIEGYALAYLTSGRDLLRMRVVRQSKSPPVVVADPAFGGSPLIAASGKSAATNGVGSASRTRIDYSQIFFGPLPGVNDEVRALRELLPNASFLTRERATKAALQGVVAPSILHIATHGFFLEDNSRVNENSRVTASKDVTRVGKWATHAGNPLLRSGLALAGANLSDGGTDNGILTALEASGLNLWGTKLVVLSACDTGVGEIRNGEGVYGLRRALVLAGAESQIMSLWPVSDRSTRDLMIGYYKRLVQGQGRGDALRRVQLQMLQSKSHGHPYYWASFIQTGEWANLEGKR